MSRRGFEEMPSNVEIVPNTRIEPLIRRDLRIDVSVLLLALDDLRSDSVNSLLEF